MSFHNAAKCLYTYHPTLSAKYQFRVSCVFLLYTNLFILADVLSLFKDIFIVLAPDYIYVV